MKKILSILLSACLLFSCSVMAFAQEFTDIAGHWAEEDIKEAQQAGIVSGDGNGLFRPNDAITRAEYFKMLTATMAELLAIEIPKGGEGALHWVADYYSFAMQAGLYDFDFGNVVQTKSGEVEPAVLELGNADYPIERWEMAFLINGIFEALELKIDGADGKLNDAAAVAKYTENIQTAIYNCAKAAIIKGDENSNFNPAKNGTRAEAVVMIKRFLEGLVVIAGEQTLTEKTEEEETVFNQAVKTYTEAEIPKDKVKVKFTMADGATFTAELYPEYAPQTVANFVALVKDGFYNGLTFHRIVDGFVVQGGDPKGDGTGGAENNIYGEFAANGWNKNTLSHEEGVLSMARSNMPDSASSQFFICIGDCSGLDGMYAAFGKVVEGMDAVKFLTKVERTMGFDGALSSPKEPVVMKTVEIVK